MQRYTFTILRFLRDNGPVDWLALCAGLGVSPRQDTVTGLVMHDLNELRKLEYIRVENWDGDPWRPPAGRIRIASRTSELVSRLGLSLSACSRLEAVGALVALPTFGVPKKPSTPADVFVVMPFRPDMANVYKQHLTKVAVRLDKTIARADDIFGTESIMHGVWTSIYHSKVVVADLTGRNANVFYELGVCHTLGRPVVMIAQSSDDIPSDVKHLRYITYEATPAGLQLLENRLSATLASVFAELEPA